MAFVLADRVLETSTSTGTGTMVLGGARDGYQAFSDAIANGDSTYYTITDGTDWEVGLANLSGNNLVGRSVISSSNSGSLVNFGAGTKEIFISYPASKLSPDTNDLNYTVSTGVINTIDTFFNLPSSWTCVELVVANTSNTTHMGPFYVEYGITGVDTTISFNCNRIELDESPLVDFSTGSTNNNFDDMTVGGSLTRSGVFFARLTRHLESTTHYVSMESVYPSIGDEIEFLSGTRSIAVSSNQNFIKVYRGDYYGSVQLQYAIKTWT